MAARVKAVSGGTVLQIIIIGAALVFSNGVTFWGIVVN
jgi:hypothetical protein